MWQHALRVHGYKRACSAAILANCWSILTCGDTSVTTGYVTIGCKLGRLSVDAHLRLARGAKQCKLFIEAFEICRHNRVVPRVIVAAVQRHRQLVFGDSCR